ncbi:hypothetical protein HAX54_046687 [Datura stramonium]|uniref:Uncharacterized protein n=1 Tax=Datura stramonium TaxID=4076 RepID=A0ABS8WJP5_DATST|nr:hypothetical protein [Datura stramonium]
MFVALSYGCEERWFYGFPSKQRQGVRYLKQGFKSLRKGVATSSSVPREPPARRFGAKAMEEHGPNGSMLINKLRIP